MNVKCPNCGLVNFATADECKRCAALLHVSRPEEYAAAEPEWGADEPFPAEGPEAKPRRSLKRKAAAGVLTALLLLFVFYISLLESSTPATYEQREAVRRAIDRIERAGLSRDAFLLRRLANFRTDDNWWNAYVGHADAYAATNFPFEVVTLYPEFFSQAADDTERAAILLHEARHLAGAGEERAFESVWRDRLRLGYTADRYGHTEVWRNIVENTRKYAPAHFTCGKDNTQDCVEQASAAR